ncbi:MAG: DUF1565 domain-containing protein [candidate division KSB1 bacterium]|nr:DUF1565 domain-containing protein [candidate division KSB1 bacterium]
MAHTLSFRHSFLPALALLLAGILVPVGVPRAFAAVDTVYVSVAGSDAQGDGSAAKPYRSLTVALQKTAGNAANPKVIKLSGGTFSAVTTGEVFPLVLKSWVTILGAGRSATFLDAGQALHVFSGRQIQQAALAGLCLQNGRATGTAAAGQGGGVWLKDFTGFTLRDCLIRDNHAANAGGGLFISKGSGLTVQNCLLENNRALNGGAMYHDSSTATLIPSSTLQHNRAGNLGGALYIAATAPTIQKCRIRWNVAEPGQQQGGGGIVLSNAMGAVIGGAFELGNDIHENTGGVQGSQLFLLDKQSTADARFNFWGVLPDKKVAAPTSQINLGNARNVAINVAFGTRTFFVAPTGSDENNGSAGQPWRTINYALSQFFATELDTMRLYLRPGIYSTAGTGENFPIRLKSRTSLLGAGRESTIIEGGNWPQSELFSAVNIAGARLTAVTLRQAGRGALVARGCERLLLDSLLVENNQGSRGAGVTIIGGSGNRVANCLFRGNHSTGNGGALALLGEDTEVVQNVFLNNSAARGGAVAADSGSTAVFEQNDFTGNRADRGGALYFAQARPQVSGNRIRQNHATAGGGALALEGASQPVIGGSRSRGNDIYDNTTAGQGTQLWRTSPGLTVDARYNFWGEVPGATTAVPANEFSLQEYRTLAIRVPRGTRTLYVSPAGNDEANGATPAAALRTLTEAMKLFFGTAEAPMTLQLLPGEYAPASNSETFPIALESHLTLTGAGREQTVITGDGIHRLFEGRQLRQVVLRHMTLRHGKSGQRGGGVWLDSVATVLIDSCHFQGNEAMQGGGLALRGCNPATIQFTQFAGNQAQLRGGGLHVEGDSIALRNCELTGNQAILEGGAVHFSKVKLASVYANTMTGNQAERGGAVMLASGRAQFFRNTIIDNRATLSGGALFIAAEANAVIGGTPENGNDLYGNQAAGNGRALAGPSRSTPNEARFNFFGARPDEAQVSSLASFNVSEFRRTSILLPNAERTLYLSPRGNDDNTAPSAKNPLRTLGRALRLFVALPGDRFTLSLANGTYSRQTTGEILPVRLPGRVVLAGSHADSVIIHGGAASRLLEVVEADSVEIRQLTLAAGATEGLQNGAGLRLQNCRAIRVIGVHFRDHTTPAFGAGLAGEAVTSLYLSQCRFTHNRGTGAALYLQNCDGEILGCTFSDNLSPGAGAALYLQNAAVRLGGCRITRNHSQGAFQGGAIFCTGTSLPVIGGEAGFGNDIFDNTGSGNGSQLQRTGNTPKIIASHNYLGSTAPTEREVFPLEGFVLEPRRTVPLAGNNPPVWVNVSPSPATPLTASRRDTLHFSASALDPDNDPLSYSWFADNFPISFAQNFAWVAFFYSAGRHTVRLEVSDGVNSIAVEWQIDLVLTTVAETQDPPPVQFQLARVFPNPMRAAASSRRIMFHTAHRSVVELVIYDVMGRRVRHLLQAEQPAGRHQVFWDGRDDSGRLLSAGVYLLHMRAGSFRATQKLVIVR